MKRHNMPRHFWEVIYKLEEKLFDPDRLLQAKKSQGKIIQKRKGKSPDGSFHASLISVPPVIKKQTDHGGCGSEDVCEEKNPFTS